MVAAGFELAVVGGAREVGLPDGAWSGETQPAGGVTGAVDWPDLAGRPAQPMSDRKASRTTWPPSAKRTTEVAWRTDPAESTSTTASIPT